MKKRVTAIFICLILMTGLLVGCTGKKESKVSTGKIGVVKDDNFGNIFIDLTIDEFNALGFAFGDSVNVEFDNGVKIEDIPYFSGYYVPVGEIFACGYSGYPHVLITRNYGTPTWEEFQMTDSSKAEVSLNEKGKYKDLEDLYAFQYSDDLADYESEIVFANFREVKGGRLKEGLLYRSASPADNLHNRAPYADDFAEDYGIDFVLNLSDNEEEYAEHKEEADFDSDYYDALYTRGDVLLLDMNANYRSDQYAKTISEALYTMTDNEGPVLVHCIEGKDRTGFVCALMLALSDATPQEIIDDYMITYDNYYGINEEDKPEKYEAILGNVNDFFYCMCEVEKGTDLNTLNLKEGAENYLRRGGLSDTQIQKIEKYLCED